MDKILETERITVRSVDAKADALFILKLLNTEGWLRFIGDRGVKSEADAVQYIEKINESPDNFYNVIGIRETGESVGMVSFMKREFLEDPDIGFALLPEFEGRGYAFEAVKLYLDFIKEAKKYSRITAFARSENTGSIRLMERLGFQFQNSFKKDGEHCSLYALDLIG